MHSVTKKMRDPVKKKTSAQTMLCLYLESERIKRRFNDFTKTVKNTQKLLYVPAKVLLISINTFHFFRAILRKLSSK